MEAPIMNLNTEKQRIWKLLVMLLIMRIIAGYGFAAEINCAVQHPLSPPDITLKGQCPNCGMGRPMWARTWFTFDAHEGQTQACSFHCLADLEIKSGSLPKNIKVAVYTSPEKSVAVENAFFVIKSSAKGTMTMKSKPAFSAQEDAEAFAKSCGGEVVNFSKALKIARQGVPKENIMISEKRLKMGKLAEPVDNTDQCRLCAMYPARYPKNKCQVTAGKNKKYHFCSTQCLFAFLKEPAKYVKTDAKPSMIWVVDYGSGRWISGYTAYYVVGSGRQGPMGHEAFAFNTLEDAKVFSGKEGGTVLTFEKVTLDKIKQEK